MTKFSEWGMGEFSWLVLGSIEGRAFLSGWAVLPQVIVEAIYLLDTCSNYKAMYFVKNFTNFPLIKIFGTLLNNQLSWMLMYFIDYWIQ